MRKNVLVDIDHTISNSFWRDSLIGGPGGWDEYHRNLIDDEPVIDVVGMINTLYWAQYTIVGITARPGKWRKLTLDWCVKHSVRLNELLMRPDDDFYPAAELKVRLASERFPNLKDEVAFIMDDREDVSVAFRELGVTALQVYARQS